MADPATVTAANVLAVTGPGGGAGAGVRVAPPGVVPSPPLFVPEPINNRLWHIPFNRVNDKLIEELVRGREDIFFGYEFAIQGGRQLPDDALRYYFSLFSDPEALRGSFAFYRAWDTTLAQNEHVVDPGPRQQVHRHFRCRVRLRLRRRDLLGGLIHEYALVT